MQGNKLTPLKTLSYASGRPEIVEGNEMKTFADCLEEIQNGEHDKYPYLQTLTDYLPPEVAEQRLRILFDSIRYGLIGNVGANALSLFNAVDIAMRERAESMSQASVTPLDNDTNESDVRREL